MESNSQARILRIFVGESDKIHHVPLYEVIVREARAAGLAGATAWRGLLAYGPTSRIKTTKLMDLSSDMPIIIEMADREEAIRAFLPRLNELLDACNSGGLVIMENVEIIQYRHHKSGGAA